MKHIFNVSRYSLHTPINILSAITKSGRTCRSVHTFNQIHDFFLFCRRMNWLQWQQKKYNYAIIILLFCYILVLVLKPTELMFCYHLSCCVLAAILYNLILLSDACLYQWHIFGLVRSGLEPTINRTRCEHANQYTTDAVDNAIQIL
jgi:hypothetical protein